MTQTKADKKHNTKKIFIPVAALTILLLMVAWLAGSFDEKVSPALHDKIKPQIASKISDSNNSYTVLASKRSYIRACRR